MKKKNLIKFLVLFWTLFGINNIYGQNEAGPDQFICSSGTNVSASAGPGVWSIVSGSATISNPTSQNTFVSNIGLGATVELKWTWNGGASSDNIIIFNKDVIANAGTDVETCTNSIFLNANNVAGVWSVSEGTAAIENPSLYNTNVTGLMFGSNIFTWTVNNGYCSVASQVTVTNNSVSVSPLSDLNACSDANGIPVTAMTPGGGETGKWTRNSGEGAFDDTLSHNTFFRNLPRGSSATVTWTVTKGQCSASTSMVVYNRTLNDFTAGENSGTCDGTMNLNGSQPPAGVTGFWTLTSGTSVTFVDQSLYNTAVTFSGYGQRDFRWTFSNQYCTEDRYVTMYYNTLGAATITSPANNANICGDFMLNGVPPGVGYGFTEWIITGGSAVLANPKSSSTQVYHPGNGTNTFKYRVFFSDCSNEATVSVINTGMPSNAGNDFTACSNTATLNAQDPSALGGTGYWTVVPGFSAQITNSLLLNTTVTNLSVDNNLFVWNVNKGGCITTDTVRVFYEFITASAGADLSTCNSTAELNGNLPDNTSGVWTAGVGVIFTDPSSFSTLAKNIPYGVSLINWTLTGKKGCTTSDNLTVTNNDFNIDAGIDLFPCTNSATMAANDPGNGSGIWQVFEGGGTFSNTTLYNSSVSGISPGISKYIWIVTKNACVKEDTVNVTFQQPSANAGADIETCSNSVSLVGNNPSPYSGNWTKISGLGSITNPSLYNSTVTLLGVGANTFMWTVQSSNCSATDQITVFNNGIPANAGIDLFSCNGTINLNANDPVPSGANGLWTVVGGTGIFVNQSLYNTSVTGLSVGANTFRWQINKGTCASTDDIIVTYENPMANAGTDIQVCNNFATITANNPSPNAGNWTKISGLGAITNPSEFSTTVTLLGVGANTFRWTVQSPHCNVFDELVVTNNSVLANAGIDLFSCNGTINLNANDPVPSGANGLWTVFGGTGIFTNQTLYNTSVTGLSVGANTFRWQITKGICVANDDVIVTFENPVPNAGSDFATCSDTVQLNANNPGIFMGLWTKVSATSGYFATPSLYNTQFIGLSYGANTFRWNLASANCTVGDEITIVNNKVIANAGTDVIVCTPSYNLQAADPSVLGATGLWTVKLPSGASFANPSMYNTTVANLSPGINRLAWSTFKNGCVNTDSLHVKYEVPFANAGTDKSVCNTSVALAANNPGAGAGYWSVVSGSGTFINFTLYNTEVINIGTGTNVFRWTVQQNSCNAFDDVIVTKINVIATAAPDITVCSSNSNLAADDPALIGAQGYWTTTSQAVIVDQTYHHSDVKNLAPGVNKFYWHVGLGNCMTIDSLFITFSPITANAGADKEICADSIFMQAVTPAGGFGNWSVISGSGIFISPSLNNTLVKNIAKGLNMYLWTVASGNCFSKDTVYITNNAINALAGPNQDICSDSTVLEGSSIPQGATGTWTVISGDGIFANQNVPNTKIYQLAPGLNVLKWTLVNQQCQNSALVSINNKSVKLTIDTLIETCSDSVIIYSNSSSPIQWSIISGTGVITKIDNIRTLISKINTPDNVYKTIVTNGFCTISKDVKLRNSGLIKFDVTVKNDSAYFNNTSPYQVAEWSWDFGDGTFSEEKNPVHKYAPNNVYEVTLAGTVDFCINMFSRKIAIGSAGCIPEFTADVQGLKVVLTTEIIGCTNSKLRWNFGDGNSGDGTITSYTYSKPGVYNICLNIWDPATNKVNSVCHEVMVGSVDCDANFDFFIEHATRKVTFTDQSLGHHNRWDWDFGYGYTSNVKNPVFVYPNNGSQEVCLTIMSDSTGCMSFACKEFLIGSNEIMADFEYFVNTDTVVFTDKSIGNAVKWYWTFGDGSAVSTEQNPRHKYTRVDEYDVCLIVTNAQGAVANKCEKVISGTMECKIVSDFAFVVDSANLTVKFMNKSVGDYSTIFWDFGDGATSTEQNPTHKYAEPDMYPVVLSVGNPATECYDAFVKTVMIGRPKCKADFEYGIDLNTKTATFKNLSSGDNLLYYWEFGDGANTTQKEPIHTFAQNGYYPVVLIVSNTNQTCFDYAVHDLQIQKIDCKADFEMVINPADNTVHFKNTSIGNPDIMYLDFGDGDSKTGNIVQVSHLYKYQGYYTASLSILNTTTGCLDYVEKQFLIGTNSQDCKADFVFRTDNPTRTVQFGDKSAGKITSYTWNFDDETVSTIQNPNHVFAKDGNYNVCLTVKNDAGITSMTCKEVFITNSASTSCKADFEFTVDTVNRIVKFSDKSLGAPNKWTWNFDDTKTDNTQNPSHTYATKGNYMVKLSIENTTTGCKADYFDLVVVANTNKPLTAQFGNKDNPDAGKASGHPVDFYGKKKGKASSVSWNYGDGKSMTGGVDNSTMNPTHVYQNTGTYKVCFTLADPISLATDTYCKNIDVAVNSVNEIDGSEFVLSLYPNPVKDVANISINLTNAQHLTIELYDMYGKRLEKLADQQYGNGVHYLQINASSYQPGNYFVKITTQTGDIWQKFIIVR